MSKSLMQIQDFWEVIIPDVTSMVGENLRSGADERLAVIQYLRDLEAIARSEACSRDVVQVIASGRRLLGDRAGGYAGDARPRIRSVLRPRRQMEAAARLCVRQSKSMSTS